MPRKPKVTRRGKNEGSVYRRKDGKDMNMQYCPDNRQKPPAEPRILTQDPPSPGRVTPSDRF